VIQTGVTMSRVIAMPHNGRAINEAHTKIHSSMTDTLHKQQTLQLPDKAGFHLIALLCGALGFCAWGSVFSFLKF